jgi:hypothetical protein
MVLIVDDQFKRRPLRIQCPVESVERPKGTKVGHILAGLAFVDQLPRVVDRFGRGALRAMATNPDFRPRRYHAEYAPAAIAWATTEMGARKLRRAE